MFQDSSASASCQHRLEAVKLSWWHRACLTGQMLTSPSSILPFVYFLHAFGQIVKNNTLGHFLAGNLTVVWRIACLKVTGSCKSRLTPPSTAFKTVRLLDQTMLSPLMSERYIKSLALQLQVAVGVGGGGGVGDGAGVGQGWNQISFTTKLNIMLKMFEASMSYMFRRKIADSDQKHAWQSHFNLTIIIIIIIVISTVAAVADAAVTAAAVDAAAAAATATTTTTSTTTTTIWMGLCTYLSTKAMFHKQLTPEQLVLT